MPVALSSDQVWNVVRRETFAVLATVNVKGQPRTAGIVYAVKDGTIYIASGRASYKARNVERNPHVSLTVTVAKRLPFLPWIKIPAATITFQGVARLRPANVVGTDVRKQLLGSLRVNEQSLADLCFIEVSPAGDFVTYGIGVPLMTLRNPEAARGRTRV